jgi:DNA-binding FadR family transcriptional regulator
MLAARGSDPDVRAALEAALTAERDALGDPAAFSHASFAFHDCVVEQSGSTTLHAVFSLLGAVLQRHSDIRLEEESAIPSGAADRATLMRAHKAHVKFVEVVMSGDVDKAEALWARHVEAISQELKSESDPRGVVDLF